MKRDKFDAVISDLCRIRCDFTCQKCHYVSSEGQATYKDRFMTASHFNGRGNGNVARYDTDLITCLCAKCHNYIETRPMVCGSMGTQPFYVKRYGRLELPNVTKVDNYGFYVPNHPKLTKDELVFIIQTINKEIDKCKELW